MPIHPSLKDLYPPDWAEISQRIRFPARAADAVNGAALSTTGRIPRPAAGSSSPPPISTTTRPTIPRATWPRSAKNATTATTPASATPTASTVS